MTRLENKRALITGGTSGIGFAAAELFRSEGASVAITGRDRGRLDAAAAKLGEVHPIVADVAKLDDIDAMIAATEAALGGLDVLFVNAGVAKLAPYDSVDEASFDAVFSVNVRGAFFTATRAAPLMPAGSSIVFTTSVNNRMGMAYSSVYAASKAALRSLVRTFGGELIGQGIRVNAVSPGPVETPIYSKLGLPEAQVEDFAEELRTKIPMKRFGKPEEIARAALFLASDEASFIHGQELVADGGWTAI